MENLKIVKLDPETFKSGCVNEVLVFSSEDFDKNSYIGYFVQSDKKGFLIIQSEGGIQKSFEVKSFKLSFATKLREIELSYKEKEEL